MSTTATREKPILFSGEMVRAILDGRKTQTRRVVKLPDDNFSHVQRMQYVGEPHDHFWRFSASDGKATKTHDAFGPYGKVGDQLRISEEVTVTPYEKAGYEVLFHADRSLVVRYGDPELMAKVRGYRDGHLRGVHLPPAYARNLRLEITGVRIERLNDISEADAEAEGVPFSLMGATHKVGFENLWNSINGSGSWAANPWTWVISFRPTEPAR